MKAVGERVRKAREHRGWSQKSLALPVPRMSEAGL